MKKFDKPLQFKILNFTFIVKPKEIIFTNKTTNTYHLQFNKGPQILKKFDQKIIINKSSPNHQFINEDQCQFKLQNQKNCKCQWAVYQEYDNDCHQFIDSIGIDIEDYFTRYLERLKKYAEEYLKIIASKNVNVDLVRDAQALREKLIPKEIFKENNKNGTITLRYQLQVRNMADHLAELQKNRLKNKSARMSKSNSMGSMSGSQRLNQLSFEMKNNENEDRKGTLIESKSYGLKDDSSKTQQITINARQPIKKRNSLLSDIMQVSNSNSSHFNHDRKNDQQRISLMSGIPEEESQSASPVHPSPAKTKTFTIQVTDKKFQRRSSTLNQNSNEENGQEINLIKNAKKRKDYQSHQDIDQRLEKEELQANLRQTRAPSTIHTQQNNKNHEQTQRKIYVKIVTIIILVILFLGSLYFLKTSLNKNASRKQKIKIAQRSTQGEKVKKPKRQRRGK